MAKKTMPATVASGSTTPKATKPKAEVLSKAIVTGKALDPFITETLSIYMTAADRIHTAVISALYHVATFGQTAPLNRLYAGLRPNDQAAVRLYLNRCNIINGLELLHSEHTLTDAEGKALTLPTGLADSARAAGAFLKLASKSFSVTNGHTSEQAKNFAKLINTRWADPDGVIDKHVLERDNFAEMRLVGDEDILKRIVDVAASLDPDKKSDRTKVAVSAKVRKLITGFGEQADAMRKQFTLAEG